MSKTPQVDALTQAWRNSDSVGAAFLQMRGLAAKFEYRLSVLEDGLRDQIAMAALQGLLANDAMLEREYNGALFDQFKDHVAKLAYSQADAMLRAREVIDND